MMPATSIIITMKLLSINVALPRQITWKGRTVTTGIFKRPVDRRVAVRRHNLTGDQQADLTVHGGASKAVYAYPSEHYPYWREQLPELDIPHAMLGENFTTEGLLEPDVRIGDEYAIGTATLAVSEPRTPCYKLAARFGRDDIVKRFLQSGRCGFYLRVVSEGHVEPGDTIERVSQHPAGITVSDLNDITVTGRADIDLLRRALTIDALGDSWRNNIQHQLTQLDP